MFDHCWNFEKASLSVRILKRDVSFKISDVKSVEKLQFENVFTRILRREGWEINDLSPLSWQFFLWNFMTFRLFSKVKSFETDFCFRKTQISEFLISWNVRFFWILSFAKDVLSQKIDCVFVLAIRGLLHMIKNFVLWCDFVF